MSSETNSGARELVHPGPWTLRPRFTLDERREVVEADNRRSKRGIPEDSLRYYFVVVVVVVGLESPRGDHGQGNGVPRGHRTRAELKQRSRSGCNCGLAADHDEMISSPSTVLGRDSSPNESLSSHGRIPSGNLMASRESPVARAATSRMMAIHISHADAPIIHRTQGEDEHAALACMLVTPAFVRGIRLGR